MAHPCLIAALRPELLRSLKRLLEPDFEVVAMVDNPVSLQDSLKVLEPELAVVDVELLGPSPWISVSVLRRRAPELLLIVLAGDVESVDLDAACDAGVDRVLQRSNVGSTLAVAARQGRAR